MGNKTNTKTFKLVLGGIMIALATVLSIIKVFELPYGGSITLFSMLPITYFGYRCGIKWGVFAGVIHGIIQLLLGSDGVRGLDIGSFIGVIIFDFLIAFTCLGLAGMFKGKIKNPAAAFTVGSIAAGLLRLLSHIVAGYIFWGEYAEWFFSQEGFEAGTWILENVSGQMLALVYSIFYNASYMLPEIIITAIGAFLLIRFAGKQILPKSDYQNS